MFAIRLHKTDFYYKEITKKQKYFKSITKKLQKERRITNMTLNGNVISGIGTAKMWVKKIENIFEEKLNIKLFPGTLNIKLKNEYTVIPNFIIKPEEFGGTQNVFVQKCNIKNQKTGDAQKAFIVRAEKNANKTGDHSTDIIEIVSDINFREKYNLKDNDLVSIEIL